jgi:hypothetical protein
VKKVATAPFALLGRMFGGGEEVNVIEFQPGEATLDAAAHERTASLAKALKERPQLQLDVPASYSPEVDRSVLSSQKLNEKLQALAEKRTSSRKGKDSRKGTSGESIDTILANPSRRFDLLLAQYRVDYGEEADPPEAAAAVLDMPRKKVEPAAFTAANDQLEAALETRQPVEQRDLEELAQARAHAVQEALLSSGDIEPTRVFLLGARSAPPADGKVRLALALK